MGRAWTGEAERRDGGLDHEVFAELSFAGEPASRALPAAGRIRLEGGALRWDFLPRRRHRPDAGDDTIPADAARCLEPDLPSWAELRVGIGGGCGTGYLRASLWLPREKTLGDLAAWLDAAEERVRRLKAQPPTFDGFPYVNTRIGRTPLQHLALLPATWPRARLLAAARTMALANQLDTCLCLGPGSTIGIDALGRTSHHGFTPFGIPFSGRLALPEEPPRSRELARRERRLHAFEERARASGGGFLVGDGLRGGRHATAEDLARLTPRGDPGLRPGLRRCAGCGGLRGEQLIGAENPDRDPDATKQEVIAVHCTCTNHNRCARCGDPLYEVRLSAYSSYGSDGGASYTPAYCGLRHRCAAEG